MTDMNAQSLGMKLIYEEEFSPLVRLLPEMAEVANAFDMAVARPQSGHMVVHALLDLNGRSTDEVVRLSNWLRDSAEAAAPRVRGRLVLHLVILHHGNLEKDLVEALSKMTSGGLMEKILMQRLTLDLNSKTSQWWGKAGSDPGQSWYEKALNSVELPELETVTVELEEREKERLALRAWLRPGITWATYLLIGINIAAWGIASSLERETGSLQQALVALGANVRELTLAQGQWWRLLTSMFLHFGLIHLAFNMMALYSVGRLLEQLLGSGPYLALYFGCGLFASMASLFNLPIITADGMAISPISAGSSGAVLAVIGALLSLKFRTPDQFPRHFAQRLYAELWRPVAFILVLGLGLSLAAALGLKIGFQLDNFAHLGGLFAGFLSMILFPLRMREKLDLQV